VKLTSACPATTFASTCTRTRFGPVSLCTIHPLYTRFTEIFGASISERQCDRLGFRPTVFDLGDPGFCGRAVPPPQRTSRSQFTMAMPVSSQLVSIPSTVSRRTHAPTAARHGPGRSGAAMPQAPRQRCSGSIGCWSTAIRGYDSHGVPIDVPVHRI
jgi:hypothetical protein